MLYYRNVLGIWDLNMSGHAGPYSTQIQNIFIKPVPGLQFKKPFDSSFVLTLEPG